MNVPSSFAQADVVDQDVTLPVAQHAAAFLALKTLWDEETVSLPASDDPVVLARALLALMKPHGWSSGLSLTGNLVGLYHDGVSPHQPVTAAEAGQVFTALAPYIEDGCYLSYRDRAPSRSAWSVVFADQGWAVEQDDAGGASSAQPVAQAHA